MPWTPCSLCPGKRKNSAAARNPNDATAGGVGKHSARDAMREQRSLPSQTGKRPNCGSICRICRAMERFKS